MGSEMHSAAFASALGVSTTGSMSSAMLDGVVGVGSRGLPVAGPLGGLLELSHGPPGSRIEPVRQGHKTHHERRPCVVSLQVGQFVAENGQPPVRAQSSPQFGRQK